MNVPPESQISLTALHILLVNHWALMQSECVFKVIFISKVNVIFNVNAILKVNVILK